MYADIPPVLLAQTKSDVKHCVATDAISGLSCPETVFFYISNYERSRSLLSTPTVFRTFFFGLASVCALISGHPPFRGPYKAVRPPRRIVRPDLSQMPLHASRVLLLLFVDGLRGLHASRRRHSRVRRRRRHRTRLGRLVAVERLLWDLNKQTHLLQQRSCCKRRWNARVAAQEMQ